MVRLMTILAFAVVVTSGCSNETAIPQAGEMNASAAADPPECGCCVILEAPAELHHRVSLFPERTDREQLEAKMRDFGQRLGLEKIAVTYVPSVDDEATDTHLNRINPVTENTVIVYNKRKVTDKFVDLKFTEQNKILLRRSVDRAGTDRELLAEER